MEKLRIGMVGAGNISQTHLAAYKKVKNAEIVAICDINEERLNETADKFGIAKRYTSETEMLANENIDAVDVCVWNVNHAKCAIEALDAGKHVLCEKPMAYSAKDAEDMLEASKRNGKLLMIGFVLRFGNDAVVAKDMIDNGIMGEVYHTKATYLRQHGAPGGWFCNKELSGGGPVIDLGVHVIDITRYYMGCPKPVSVYAVTQEKLKNRPHLKTDVGWKPKDAKDDDIFNVEDFATALIRYDNGSTTLLQTSYSLNGTTETSQELFGTKGGFKLGGAAFEGDKSFKVYTEINGYLAEVKPETSNLKNVSGDMFYDEMQHFVDCVLYGTPCKAPAEDGVAIMKILDAIYESARTGHEVIL